ncbi:MAG: hypothetical protein IJI75_08860 [Solobacterium sp.]|nr:hypothetical protein [Solobacterium sp.]MBR0340914.1 hypothetical protein [Oscillospiraceae bacterium]
MEDRIDEMLEERVTADEAYEKKVNTEIRTGMIRTIYSRVLIVFLVIALICMGGYSAYLSYRESHAFHLDQFENLADAGAVRDEAIRQCINTSFLIQCYYEVTQPGYYIYTNGSVQATRESYETFRMEPLHLVHYFKTNKEASRSASVIESVRVTRFLEPTYYSAYEGSFYLEGQPYSWWAGSREYIDIVKGSIPSPEDELSDLSASASAEIELLFKRDMSVEEMLAFAKEYPESEILFALTGLPNEENAFMPEGFSLLFGACNMAFSKEAMNKYPMIGMSPNFSMGNAKPKYTAEDYVTHYKSVLSLLINNRFGYLYEIEQWQRRLDKLEKGEELRVIGVRIISSRNDALNLTQDERIQDLHILDMKMNRFDN